MKKVLILHGTDASPKDNWFTWLKGKLIGQGYTVWLPQLPQSDQPNARTYTKFILSNDTFVIDTETIIIGHSSGAVEILSLLQALPDDAQIKAAFLVSAFKDDLGWEALKDLFKTPFDYEAIKSKCQEFILVHSDDDPYVPLEQAEYLAERLDGELIVMEGQGHFNTELSPDYVKFPELFEIIKSVVR